MTESISTAQILAESRVGTSRRDPESTRTAILEAAEAVFVERGFAAAAMRMIAEQASVTKSLIHHHFGSKATLWVEVKRRRFAKYSVAQREFMATPGTGIDRFAQSIRNYFGFLQGNPEYLRLNAWMNLEDSPEEHPDPELRKQGLEWIEEAQKDGQIRGDVLPKHVIAAFLSLCEHWFLARHSWDRRRPLDDESKAADDAYLEDLLKIFFEGLVARDGHPAAR